MKLFCALVLLSALRVCCGSFRRQGCAGMSDEPKNWRLPPSRRQEDGGCGSPSYSTCTSDPCEGEQCYLLRRATRRDIHDYESGRKNYAGC